MNIIIIFLYHDFLIHKESINEIIDNAWGVSYNDFLDRYAIRK